MTKQEEHTENLTRAASLILNVAKESNGPQRHMLNVALVALDYASGVLPAKELDKLITNDQARNRRNRSPR